jgi:hypothetical protein
MLLREFNATLRGYHIHRTELLAHTDELRTALAAMQLRAARRRWPKSAALYEMNDGMLVVRCK